MSESISKNNELENEMTLDMSYFWYSDEGEHTSPPAKSYFCFIIEHDTLSGTEVPMFQTV